MVQYSGNSWLVEHLFALQNSEGFNGYIRIFTDLAFWPGLPQSHFLGIFGLSKPAFANIGTNSKTDRNGQKSNKKNAPCHVASVMCHMSHVTYCMSCVTFHLPPTKSPFLHYRLVRKDLSPPTKKKEKVMTDLAQRANSVKIPTDPFSLSGFCRAKTNIYQPSKHRAQIYQICCTERCIFLTNY